MQGAFPIGSDVKATVLLDSGVQPLFGTRDENLHLLEESFHVELHLGDEGIGISGGDDRVARARRFIQNYADFVHGGRQFSADELKSFIQVIQRDPSITLKELVEVTNRCTVGKKSIRPRSTNQWRYMAALERDDLVFGLGPAGTGKTYLAVAMAVYYKLSERVKRIILTRPAVEAGERLGFLPGTLQEKIDPYLRPLYDALHDMLDGERVKRMMEKGEIEVAPVAFMRGRTLNDSYIILDEAQNCTPEQIKMVLTRQGFNSKMVVTGDLTQTDLPHSRASGLQNALDVLEGVEGIGFVEFDERDVVRHPLVQKIIMAYDRYQNRANPQLDLRLHEPPAEEIP
ncbi:MAG: PhoH family protein [Bryobacterales bacterium]|nr:PhoH family protein [Bryobacterales bacterium]